MMHSGSDALGHLATKLDQLDAGASSHWQKYHAGFNYTGTGFQGLQGFGGCQPPPGLTRRAFTRLLQRRYRAMGREFSEFAASDHTAGRIAALQGRAYDLDLLRQSLTLAFLRRELPSVFGPHATACVIGDGFASMTTLLLATSSLRQVILVNLTKTLMVDLWYLKLWMGEAVFNDSVHLVDDAESLDSALALPTRGDVPGRVIAIQAKYQHLVGAVPADLVINIASMQEMNPSTIAGYFSELRKISGRRPVHFYCCNREEKQLPDGTVTRIGDYPWQAGDRLLVDGLCPWHQHYYSLRPPFYRPYDGPIRHRLVLLE